MPAGATRGAAAARFQATGSPYCLGRRHLKHARIAWYRPLFVPSRQDLQTLRLTLSRVIQFIVVPANVFGSSGRTSRWVPHNLIDVHTPTAPRR